MYTRAKGSAVDITRHTQTLDTLAWTYTLPIYRHAHAAYVNRHHHTQMCIYVDGAFRSPPKSTTAIAHRPSAAPESSHRIPASKIRCNRACGRWGGKEDAQDKEERVTRKHMCVVVSVE